MPWIKDTEETIWSVSVFKGKKSIFVYSEHQYPNMTTRSVVGETASEDVFSKEELEYVQEKLQITMEWLEEVLDSEQASSLQN